MATRRQDTSTGGTITELAIPAQLRFIGVVRAAIRSVVEGTDDVCDAGYASDLQLAGDELAGVMITSARASGELLVSIAEDGTDSYVRMTVPVATSGFRPPAPELTRMLLDATADSYEVCIDGDHLVGVIQRAVISDHLPARTLQDGSSSAGGCGPP